MLIHKMSDLHLEFNPNFRAQNFGEAEALILAGDICVAEVFNKSEASPQHATGKNFVAFFEDAATKYRYIFYIPGNHEHYSGRFPNTVLTLRRALGHISNLYILDNSAVELNGILFLGTTLWTDCNKSDPLAIDALSNGMNDFKLINNSVEGWQRFIPANSAREHRIALDFIDKWSRGHSNVVVISHHAPSYKSIHPDYRKPRYESLNHGYYSNLDDFILARSQIKLWVHGHVHNNHDYMIGSTRVVCCPHGYGKENIDEFGIGAFIEV